MPAFFLKGNGEALDLGEREDDEAVLGGVDKWISEWIGGWEGRLKDERLDV